MPLRQVRDTRVWTPTIVWLTERPTEAYCPPSNSDHNAATVAVDSHRSGCGGKVQVPRGMAHRCPGNPNKGPLNIFSQHSGDGAG